MCEGRVAEPIRITQGLSLTCPTGSSSVRARAYHLGRDTRGKFLQGAPILAVGVRSEDDYGPAAEREMAAKSRDYFAAGTHVVWDADVLGSEVVSAYRATDSSNPRV
jgi:hypothetical protein